MNIYSARLPYVHHDMVTNREGVTLSSEVVVVRMTSWRKGVFCGRPRVWYRSRVYTRIDALPFKNWHRRFALFAKVSSMPSIAKK
jgi:hypothetical protein